MPGDYTILVTDRQLVVAGDPIVNWDTLDATLRFNEPGSGLFVAPGYPWIRDQIQPGNRIALIRDGQHLISGQWEQRLFERSDDGENAGDGKITVNFADDLAEIVARATYPDPTKTPETQTIDNWTFTGNAEVALRTLVNLNAGPGALASRRMPKLVLGPLAGVGTTVTVKAERMEPMGDVMRRIAQDGGGLGFRTRQSGNQILFEVYQPPNVSGSVRWSFGLGNVKYLAHETKAPTATTVIVGGQGEGADRFVKARTNSADEAVWGRRETLLSRPGSSPAADLDADADRELADGAATVRVPSNVVDTADQMFGVHYQLGSKVAMSPWPGEQITDLIQMVHLQAWATAGEIFAPMIGSQAATSDPAVIKTLRAFDARLSRLERNAQPSAI